MIDLIWYFYLYSFLGWCIEVIFAAVKGGGFVNRGFLNGPYCPIYGIGVIFVINILKPVQDNLLFLFLGAVLITSIIEYIVGLVLERIFHQRWWDYSDMPFNAGGYICLMFSLIWGIACLIIVDRIHPLLQSMTSLIPVFAIKIFLIVITGFFVFDVISTVKAVLKLNKKLELIDGVSKKMREVSDNIGEILASGTITIVQKSDNIKEEYETKKELFEDDLAEFVQSQQKNLEKQKRKLEELKISGKEIMRSVNSQHKRLLKAFPSLKSLQYKSALEKLKAKVLKGIHEFEDENKK